MIDYRFAPPPAKMLGVQWGLPGFGLILTVVRQPVPPVYECVCGELSATPLPRCQECDAVLCTYCRTEGNPTVCCVCAAFGYPL